MNLEKRFMEVLDFLDKHSELINSEALDYYPHGIPSEYETWVDEIVNLNTEQLIALENGDDYSFIKDPTYKNFLKERESLLTLKAKTYDASSQDLPKSLLVKLNPKKIHEVTQIRESLKETKTDLYIDIGSGAGHLSSILLHENKKHSLCIDGNEEYQKIGKVKLSRQHKDILERIDFVNKMIHTSDDLNFIKVKERTTLLGLHCCGDLSNQLIKVYNEHGNINNLLSFGCCYHKLEHHQLNLSTFAKEKRPMNFSNYALTMAAKQSFNQDQKKYKKKLQVKKYRYSLHMFALKTWNEAPHSIGNGRQSDYEKDFYSYLIQFLPKAQESEQEDVLAYYNSEQNQNWLKKILALGIIRSNLARAIEYAILIDRALYLQEKGHHVSLSQYFNPKISPRNIGILASK